MAIWKDVEDDSPEFAARVRAIFDAHKHKTIATLRADGAPRISGIEVQFADGELTFGSMHRDPRFALHSASMDPPEGNEAAWAGDAKVAGRVVFSGELDGPPAGELFRADLDEVVWTGLDATASALVIETWRPAQRLRRVERA